MSCPNYIPFKIPCFLVDKPQERPLPDPAVRHLTPALGHSICVAAKLGVILSARSEEGMTG